MEKGTLYRRLGKNIQHLRKMIGLTQIELADRISRTEDAVSNIERGASAPRPDTASAIARALGCELTDLYDFDWSGRPVPQDLKDFLRNLRGRLTQLPEKRRHQLYDLIEKILFLLDET